MAEPTPKPGKPAGTTPNESRAADRPASRPRRRRWPRRLAIAAVVLVALYALIGFFGVPLIVQKLVVPRASGFVHGELTIERVACNPFAFAMTFENIVVTEASGDEALRVNQAAGDFDPFATLFRDGYRFAYLRVVDPTVNLGVDEQGRVNLIELLDLPPPDEEPDDEPFELPRVVIGDFQVQSAAIHVRDRMTDPAAETSVTGLSLSLDHVDTHPDHANPHTMTATLGDLGTVTWTGTTHTDPLTLAGTLEVDGFRITPLSPYAAMYGGLAVDEGRVVLKIDYRLTPLDPDERVTIEDASLAVRDLAVSLDGRRLMGLDVFEFAGVSAEIDRGKVHADALRVKGFDAEVRRNPRGGLEVLEALANARRSPLPASGDEGGAATAGASTSRLAMAERHPIELLVLAIYRAFADRDVDYDLSLDGLEVAETTLRFEDRSTPETVSLALAEITLDAGELANRSGVATPIELSLVGPGDAPIMLRGEAQLMDRKASGEVRVEGLDLHAGAPYIPRDLPEPVAGLDLASAYLDLDGAFEGVRDDTGFTAAWDGRVTLRDLETTKPDAEPPLRLETASVEGRAEVDAHARQAGPTLDASWVGTNAVTGFAAAASLEGYRAALGLDAMDVESEIDFVFADEGFDTSWAGRVAVRGVRADAAIPEGEALPGPIDATLTLAEGRLVDASTSYRRGALAFAAEALTLDAPTAKATVPVAWRGGGPVAVDVEPAEDGVPEEVAAVPEDATGSTTGDDAPPEAEPTSPLALPFDFRLGRFTLSDGAFDLVERGEADAITLSGREARAEVTTLDTADPDTPAEIDAETRVLDVGRAALTGTATPFADVPLIDLTAVVSDLPLRPLSPVVEPQLGFAIDRGRLSLDLPVRVEDYQLDGNIDARLRSFYLGTEVESEAAPNLPLKLILDLLRDRDDTISLQVGIAGDTADPAFSFGKLIWRSVFKVFASVAASPFNLVARALPGGGETDLDLSRAAFVPGTTDFAEGQTRAVELLAQALQQRPQLRLLVVGHTGEADEAALKDEAVDALVADRASALGLSTDDALRAVFEDRFPPQARLPVPVPPGRLDQGTPDPRLMRRRLRESVEVTDDQRRELAQARAQRVVTLLTTEGGLDPARVERPQGGEAAAGEAGADQAVVTFELLPGPRAPEHDAPPAS